MLWDKLKITSFGKLYIIYMVYILQYLVQDGWKMSMGLHELYYIYSVIKILLILLILPAANIYIPI